MTVQDPDFRLVVAFEFGTTYCGYAFSFRDSPLKVSPNDSDLHNPPVKLPTSLLVQPNGEFHSFGSEADDKYAKLAAEEAHNGWLLFRGFKMLLHNTERLNRKTTITDINGVSRPAISIFTMAIRYLKKHFMENAFKQSYFCRYLHDRDIRYVLTVPAIWNRDSKHFMREAAVEAGLEDSQLQLCLEPVAASIWCLSITCELGIVEHHIGIPFMLIDLGGGTADICVYEKKADHTYGEIFKDSGGPWGGDAVVQNYMKWLKKLLGNAIVKKFKDEHMSEYFDLLRDFEIEKERCYSSDKKR